MLSAIQECLNDAPDSPVTGRTPELAGSRKDRTHGSHPSDQSTTCAQKLAMRPFKLKMCVHFRGVWSFLSSRRRSEEQVLDEIDLSVPKGPRAGRAESASGVGVTYESCVSSPGFLH